MGRTKSLPKKNAQFDRLIAGDMSDPYVEALRVFPMKFQSWPSPELFRLMIEFGVK